MLAPLRNINHTLNPKHRCNSREASFSWAPSYSTLFHLCWLELVQNKAN